jgi:hypothetical protein
MIRNLLPGLLCPLLSFAQPSNDEPCGAIPLTVSTTCAYTSGTNAAATASPGVPAPGCAFYNGGDVWYSAVVPANGVLIVDTDDGTMTDSGMAFYSGTCGALTLIECDDSDSPNGLMSLINRTGLTPGSTVFIRIWSWGNSGNGTFSICATTPVIPDNDNPCSAIPLNVSANCSYTSATNLNATATSGIPAPGCAAYNGGDVWFSITVPASGAVVIDSQTGTMTDGGMAVYTAGSCSGPFTLVSCDDDSSPNGSMPKLTVLGQTPGSTLYIRFWEFVNDNPGTFSICATSTGACGFPETSDFCPDPAPLAQGPGTFSSTTDGTFTPDLPGNLGSVFCGTIENNSWYQFTALSTTETFPITSVTGCNLNLGIQGVVYSLTYNANGCCTAFTQVSNCYSPSNTSTGTVTATGLTIGQQYLLMIDGYSNDGCEFTISGWNVLAPLSAEMTSFGGSNHSEGILLSWQTDSEVNTDFFEVQHSVDGNDFSPLGTVEADGNSLVPHAYDFLHEWPSEGLHYYRLRQLDLNGTERLSETIAVKREIAATGLAAVFPNPAADRLTLRYRSEYADVLTVLICDHLGNRIYSAEIPVGKGLSELHLPLETIRDGAYLLKIASENASEQLPFVIVH